MTAALPFALLLVLVGSGARAQSDPQTDQHAEEDQKYLERIRAAKEKTATATTPEQDPVAARKAAAEAFLGEAEQLIRDQNFSSRASEGFKVMTDDPRVDTVAALALLDGFSAWFESFWAGKVELRPTTAPARVYLFYSFYRYNQLLTGQKRFTDFRPSGHYRALADAVILHTDAVPPGDLPDVLVHEAAHQQIEQRLLGSEAATPLWLAEGLASYFGYTARLPTGTFENGTIGGKSAAVVRGTSKATPKEPRARLERVHLALKPGSEWSLDGLLRVVDPREFYGGDPDTGYAASWVLVHWLLRGDGGAHADAFAHYLLRVREGDGSADVLYATIGKDAASLQTALATYARTLRVP